MSKTGDLAIEEMENMTEAEIDELDDKVAQEPFRKLRVMPVYEGHDKDGNRVRLFRCEDEKSRPITQNRETEAQARADGQELVDRDPHLEWAATDVRQAAPSA